MKPSVAVVKNMRLTKIQVSEKLNNIDQCFYQIVLILTGKNQLLLTLICLSFLRVSFVMGDGKITPCLKLVGIMLEDWSSVRLYTHICSFRKYVS